MCLVRVIGTDRNIMPIRLYECRQKGKSVEGVEGAMLKDKSEWISLAVNVTIVVLEIVRPV